MKATIRKCAPIIIDGEIQPYIERGELYDTGKFRKDGKPIRARKITVFNVDKFYKNRRCALSADTPSGTITAMVWAADLILKKEVSN